MSAASARGAHPLDVPRPASASTCTMTEIVLPSHANGFGTVFGGAIMSWVDLCGAIAAQRHTGRMVVTAFVDDVHFQAPVKVGQVVRLEGRVTATFRTSLEVCVVVHGEEATTGQIWPCVTALLTFVALDDAHQPTAIAPLLLHDDAARRGQREAEERKARRLSRSATRSA